MAPRGETDEVPLVETTHSARSCLPNKVFIEPLVVLYIVSGLPMSTLTSQFMVHKVAQSMGIDYDNLGGNSSVCVANKSDPAYIEREQVQQETANWNIYMTLIHFIPGVLMPIILGSLADKLGRKMLMILPLIGSLLTCVVWMLMIGLDLPVWFCLFTTVEQLFGGMGTLFIGAFSYISDTVDPKKHGFRMTLVDSISLSSGGIANLFVGHWIAASGYFWPLIFVAAGKVLALLYAIFIIPETLVTSGSGDTASARSKLKLRDYFQAVFLLVSSKNPGRRWKLNLILSSYFVHEIFSAFTIMGLFLMNTPLCWGAVMLGNYFCIYLIVSSVSGVAVAAVPPRWISVEWRMVASRISSLAASIFTIFVNSTPVMFLTPVIGCLAFLHIPLTRATIGNLVDKDERASAYATVSTLMVITMAISSSVTNEIYGETLYILNGRFTFMLCAGCAGIGLVLLLVYVIQVQAERNVTVLVNEDSCVDAPANTSIQSDDRDLVPAVEANPAHNDQRSVPARNIQVL